jgi:hypothetical protein
MSTSDPTSARHLRLVQDWRRKYFFPGPAPSPQRWPASDALEEAREEFELERQRTEHFDRDAVASHRQFREQQATETWRDLVEQYGAQTVETVMRRVDPHFALPTALREEKR